jgi:hypothetical protein
MSVGLQKGPWLGAVDTTCCAHASARAGLARRSNRFFRGGRLLLSYPRWAPLGRRAPAAGMRATTMFYDAARDAFATEC